MRMSPLLGTTIRQSPLWWTLSSGDLVMPPYYVTNKLSIANYMIGHELHIESGSLMAYLYNSRMSTSFTLYSLEVCLSDEQ